MTDRELMQMALDALNQYINVVTSDNNPERWAVLVDGGGPARTAISALRDRLAKPTCTCGVPEDLGIVHRVDKPCFYYSENWPEGWVGFTRDELAWLDEALNLNGRFAVIEAIEAKLKEKNNG